MSLVINNLLGLTCDNKFAVEVPPRSLTNEDIGTQVQETTFQTKRPTILLMLVDGRVALLIGS